MHEDSLLTGPLEPTNEAYAVAKLAGIKLCQSYRSQHGSHFIAPIPTNLFGPGDNFDPAASHVVPAMIRKVQEAMSCGGNVSIWGTGKPSREFLFVDDAADAVVFLMRHFDGPEPINIGSGEDITISRLAETIAEYRDLAERSNTIPASRMACRASDWTAIAFWPWGGAPRRLWLKDYGRRSPGTARIARHDSG